MFKPGKPSKITKEQLDALLVQTRLYKDYFSNLESSLQLSKDGLDLFPMFGATPAAEHLEKSIEQAHIYKKYFEMTETYMGMVANNVDLWHAMFIDKKPKKSK